VEWCDSPAFRLPSADACADSSSFCCPAPDFTLRQLGPDAFSIWKRIDANGCWLTQAGHGKRAAGLGYVGGAAGGGVVFSQRNFWQMAPRSLDIANAGTDAADVTLWAYSPAGTALDLRHYSCVPSDCA
jgi:hypothetical protein